MAGKKKTAQKAAPGRRKPSHGKGELLTGGMPGNKGGTGRPPLAFKQFAQELARDPEFQASLKTKALEGDVSAQKLVVQYAEGLPAQDVHVSDPSGGPITVRFVHE